jgi:hypothetical protein
MTNSESILQLATTPTEAGHRAEHPARNYSGTRTVRFCLQGIRAALDVQTAHAGVDRFLPHDGGRDIRAVDLDWFLARLVLHHISIKNTDW